MMNVTIAVLFFPLLRFTNPKKVSVLSSLLGQHRVKK